MKIESESESLILPFGEKVRSKSAMLISHTSNQHLSPEVSKIKNGKVVE